MDPFSVVGIVANVGQLIAAAATLIRGLNDIKNAPRDRARLTLECATLVAFLTQLRYAVEDLGGRSEPQLNGLHLLATNGGPLEQLTNTIEELADKVKPGDGRAGRMLKALTWPFEKGEVDSILVRIERFKSLVSLHQDGDHFRISLRMHDDIVEVKGDIDMSLKEQERREILGWISDLNFSRKQADNLARSQSGTGVWFLESATFKNWIDMPPRILWCYGQPGAGKTILASLIISHLQHRYGSQRKVAYVYLNYKEHESQTVESLVTSLLKQLAYANGPLSEDIISTFRRHSQKASRPTFEEWSNLLHSEAARFSVPFIVVDALDECPEDGVRDALMREVRRLQSRAHILITSRFVPSLEIEFSHDLKAEIRAADSDVKEYLEERIRNEGRLIRLLKDDWSLKATVVESIVDNAKGMFLLAQLQMDSVSKKNNRRDVRRSLQTLPQRLHDTYDEAMRRIRSQSQEDIDLAERLLSWIVYAKRPLTVIEVQHALTVEKDDNHFDQEGIPDEGLMIGACAGLVTIEMKSEVIRLVHHTAQEYFESFVPLRLPGAQILITSTCLTYLSLSEFRSESLSHETFHDTLTRYPLVTYAVSFWGAHARGDSEAKLEDEIIGFLTDLPKITSWYRIVQYLEQGYDTPSSKTSGLHIACRLGLPRIANILIEKCGIDINTRDSAGRTPLYWAARYGEEGVVKALLQNPNIIADAPSARGQTPLFAAAVNGHTSVVSILLQRPDVSPNTISPPYSDSPLSRAVELGHTGVIKALLSHPHININIRSKLGGVTPLWLAVHHGWIDVVLMLLQRPELDVNITDTRRHQTALQLAVQNGHGAITKLLSHQGYSPNDSRSRDNLSVV